MEKIIQNYMNLDETPIEPDSTQSDVDVDRQINLRYSASFYDDDDDADDDWTTTSASEGEDLQVSTAKHRTKRDLNAKLGDEKTEEGHFYEAEENVNDLEWDDEDLFLVSQSDIELVPDPNWIIKRSARYMFYFLFVYILCLLVLRFFPHDFWGFF